MSTRTVKIRAINAAVAATTASIKTDRLSEIEIVVDYTGDGVDSAATMTVYGSQDAGGLVKNTVGIQPILTGTRDADGAIAYSTANTTVAYQVPGSHPYLWIDLGTITDDVVFSAWVVGKETY